MVTLNSAEQHVISSPMLISVRVGFVTAVDRHLNRRPIVDGLILRAGERHYSVAICSSVLLFCDMLTPTVAFAILPLMTLLAILFRNAISCYYFRNIGGELFNANIFFNCCGVMAFLQRGDMRT